MARWRSYARVYTAPECGFRHPDKKADGGVSTIEPRVAKHTWMLQCTLARNAVGWPQLSVLLGTNTSVNSRAAPCLCDACDCIVWLHRCSMRARKQPWINRQTAARPLLFREKLPRTAKYLRNSGLCLADTNPIRITRGEDYRRRCLRAGLARVGGEKRERERKNRCFGERCNSIRVQTSGFYNCLILAIDFWS